MLFYESECKLWGNANHGKKLLQNDLLRESPAVCFVCYGKNIEYICWEKKLFITTFNNFPGKISVRISFVFYDEYTHQQHNVK